MNQIIQRACKKWQEFRKLNETWKQAEQACRENDTPENQKTAGHAYEKLSCFNMPVWMEKKIQELNRKVSEYREELIKAIDEEFKGK